MHVLSSKIYFARGIDPIERMDYCPAHDYGYLGYPPSECSYCKSTERPDLTTPEGFAELQKWEQELETKLGDRFVNTNGLNKWECYRIPVVEYIHRFYCRWSLSATDISGTGSTELLARCEAGLKVHEWLKQQEEQ